MSAIFFCLWISIIFKLYARYYVYRTILVPDDFVFHQKEFSFFFVGLITWATDNFNPTLSWLRVGFSLWDSIYLCFFPGHSYALSGFPTGTLVGLSLLGPLEILFLPFRYFMLVCYLWLLQNLANVLRKRVAVYLGKFVSYAQQNWEDFSLPFRKFLPRFSVSCITPELRKCLLLKPDHVFQFPSLSNLSS